MWDSLKNYGVTDFLAPGENWAVVLSAVHKLERYYMFYPVQSFLQTTRWLRPQG
jgi:hypothetical protein